MPLSESFAELNMKLYKIHSILPTKSIEIRADKARKRETERKIKHFFLKMKGEKKERSERMRKQFEQQKNNEEDRSREREREREAERGAKRDEGENPEGRSSKACGLIPHKFCKPGELFVKAEPSARARVFLKGMKVRSRRRSVLKDMSISVLNSAMCA